MKVYKFGGASVRNADRCATCARLSTTSKISSSSFRPWARRPTLEKRCSKDFRRATNSSPWACRRAEYHAGIIDDLWRGHKQLERVDALFDELERVAVETVYKPSDAELWYDTIVLAFGELVSTTIISEYLNYAGVSNRWIDMRRCFLTEQRHKDAGVDIRLRLRC